jgi:hypothetical protein
VEEKAIASFAADWPHILIVGGENRTFYLDYVSYSLKEIDSALLEMKQVNCIEAFALEDVIALGCSDGAVRIWHVLNGTVTKLATNSNKPIVGMFSHYSDVGTFLTAVSEDGIFSKWRVHSNSEPTAEFKEGKGSYDVYGMTFDSTEHALMILTDVGIIIRDYYNNKETARYKLPSSSKQSYVSLKFFGHTKFAGSSTLALSKDGKSIGLVSTKASGSAPSPMASFSFGSMPAVVAAGTELEPMTLLDVAEWPKSPETSKIKFLFFDIHQTNPTLVFVATSVGLSIVHVDSFATPRFALIKAEAPPPSATTTASPPIPSANSAPKISSRASSNALQLQPQPGAPSRVFFVSESQIWSIASAGPNERGAIVSFPSPFASLAPGHGGDDSVRIATSPSGSYLSVMYEKLNKYDIYSIETKKVIDTGSRILGLVWCQSKEGPITSRAKDGTPSQSGSGSLSARGSAEKDVFAFLEGPPSAASGAGGIGGAGTDSKTKKKGVSVSEASATRTVTLNVKKVGNSAHDTIVSFETGWNSNPRVFTGPLIGVDLKPDTSSSNASSSSSTISSNFQFYTWTGEKIGIPMPSPLEVQWDLSSMKYCLFTYEQYFCVFSIRPKFKLMAKVSGPVLSSLWYNGCLFYTTRTDLKCFFASVFDSREAVISATPTDAFSSSLLSSTQQLQENLNGCSIVELANDKIVLLTHDHRIVSIIIDNPVTQFYVLAHAGRVTAAVQLANAVVPTRHHPMMSKFLEARGRVDAAGALNLPPQYKLQLYLKHGYLAEAHTVFSSMVKQCRLDMNSAHEIDLDGTNRTFNSLHVRKMLVSAAHKLVQTAMSAGNMLLIGKVWSRLAKIEPTAYRHLALFYAQNGFTQPLQDLYKQLCNEASRDPAIKEEIKFVAVHLSDKALSDSLQAASNSYAEYIISLHETAEREAELIETWNARIGAESDADTLLSGSLSNTSGISYSTTMLKTNDSKEKSRSPIIW